MIICQDCGWSNRDNACFCARCGVALSTAATSADEALPEPQGQPTRPLELAFEEAIESLEPGSLLQQRFQIVQQIEEQPEARVYRAIDLDRCAACGAVGVSDDDGYCAQCGASLDAPCFVRIVELCHQEPPAHDEHLTLGDRDYYITIERPAGAPKARPDWAVLRVGMRTDVGAQREVNEDAIDSRIYERTGERRLGLFVVADGLGGQASGEVASMLAVQQLWHAVYADLWAPAMVGQPAERSPEDVLTAAALAADRAVAAARSERGNDMSSTLVAALVLDSAVHIVNVGDSRAYLFDQRGLRQLTHDHSLVQRLVDAGKLEPAGVFTHPHRNVIYNSLGDAEPAQVDLFHDTLTPATRLLLCSDGLWEMLRDEGIEEVLMAEPDPQRACDLLVDRANLAGGEDNISVIVAQLDAGAF